MVRCGMNGQILNSNFKCGTNNRGRSLDYNLCNIHTSPSDALGDLWTFLFNNKDFMSSNCFWMFLVRMLVLNVKKITLTDIKKTPASRNMSWVKPLVKSAAINRASVIKIIAIVDVFSILMCNVKNSPHTQI